MYILEIPERERTILIRIEIRKITFSRKILIQNHRPSETCSFLPDTRKRRDHTPVLVGAEVHCTIVNINYVYIARTVFPTIRRVSRHIARRNHLTALARAYCTHGQHMAYGR